MSLKHLLRLIGVISNDYHLLNNYSSMTGNNAQHHSIPWMSRGGDTANSIFKKAKALNRYLTKDDTQMAEKYISILEDSPHLREIEIKMVMLQCTCLLE